MGRLVPLDRGEWIDKRIRDAGCFSLTNRGRLYFYPDGKLPPEIYRALQDDPELRIELRLFLLKNTTAGIKHGG